MNIHQASSFINGEMHTVRCYCLTSQCTASSNKQGNLQVLLKSRWWETLDTAASSQGLAPVTWQPNTKFFKCCASIEFTFERYWHTVSFSSNTGYLEGHNCIIWICARSINSSSGLIRSMMHSVINVKYSLGQQRSANCPVVTSRLRQVQYSTYGVCEYRTR